MELKKIDYKEQKPRQKENYNFQKVAGLLANYGFNCIKLSDDWQGADFLAYHKDKESTLKVQLKSRLTIDKKYHGKGLYIAFPLGQIGKHEEWHLIEHDYLIELVDTHTNFLKTHSWKKRNGAYSSDNPNKRLITALDHFKLEKQSLPKPFIKSDFKAAVRDPNSGRIFTGVDHLEALKAAQAEGIHSLGQENTGFKHKDGTFHTRQETEKEWGFKITEDLR